MALLHQPLQLFSKNHKSVNTFPTLSRFQRTTLTLVQDILSCQPEGPPRRWRQWSYACRRPSPRPRIARAGPWRCTGGRQLRTWPPPRSSPCISQGGWSGSAFDVAPHPGRKGKCMIKSILYLFLKMSRSGTFQNIFSLQIVSYTGLTFRDKIEDEECDEDEGRDDASPQRWSFLLSYCGAFILKFQESNGILWLCLTSKMIVHIELL